MGLPFLTFLVDEKGRDDVELDMRGSIRVINNDITVDVSEVKTSPARMLLFLNRHCPGDFFVVFLI